MTPEELKALSADELFLAGETLHAQERALIVMLRGGESWRSLGPRFEVVWGDLALVRKEIVRRFLPR